MSQGEAPTTPAVLIIYTDGSCTKNGFEGAKAGSGIYFGENHPLNCSVAVPGLQTNNRAELWAIIHAIRLVKDNYNYFKQEAMRCETFLLEIRTDSLLTIKCATREWNAKENLDLFKLLWEETSSVPFQIKYKWVKGHNKEPGNEAADQLAKGFINYKKSRLQ